MISSWLRPLLMPGVHANAFAQMPAFVEGAHQYLLNLCSISAGTFSSNPKESKTLMLFLNRLMGHLLPLLEAGHQSHNRDHIVLLSTCTRNCLHCQNRGVSCFRAFDALSRSHTCTRIVASAKDVSTSNSLLPQLASLLRAFLETGSMAPNMEDTTEQECCIRLLNATIPYHLPGTDG